MKKGHRLADVCRKLELQPYVLRYWATEFPMLQHAEGGGSATRRSFSDDDLALLKRIKRLLYEEGYTIAGAKKKLEVELSSAPEGSGPLFEENAGDEASDRAAETLDTSADERIESLRQGIATALEEARAILSLLESSR